MEEADSKNVAMERILELEDELGRVNEIVQEYEVSSGAVHLLKSSSYKLSSFKSSMIMSSPPSKSDGDFS